MIMLLDGILELLDDEVEVVPAVVSEESGIEGEGDLGVVLLGVLPGEVLGLACKFRKLKAILIQFFICREKNPVLYVL